MKKKTHCQHCRRHFSIRPQTPRQRFCSLLTCQRERKRLWQKMKRQADSDYQENEKTSQRHWRSCHPNYWKDYRQHHPDYEKRNREQQKQRDKRRLTRPQGMLANVDASILKIPLESGLYEVVSAPELVACKRGPVNPKNIFKINRLAVHL